MAMKLNFSKSYMKLQEIVLILMYFVASLTVINRDILSLSNILLIRYSVVTLGTIFFIFSYRKKFFRGYGKVAIPSKVNSWSLILFWIFFSISVIISQAFNGYFPVEGFTYLIFNTVIFFMLIPKSLENPVYTIVRSSFYASFSYLILSALYEPIVFGSYYTGITYNPNSLGQLAVQASISSLCLLLNTFSEIRLKKKKIILYFGYFIISIAFVLLSKSRASFVAVLLSSIVTLVFYFKSDKVKIGRFIIPAIAFVFIYFVKLKDFLQIGILDKFNRYSGESILTGRNQIWNKIFEDMTMLGNGPSYLPDIIGKGAHNSILEIVAVFGVFSGILVTLFYIASIIVSLKYARSRKKSQYFYVPLAVVMAFFVLSMAESMFGVIGKSITLVFLNVMGVLMFGEVAGRNNLKRRNFNSLNYETRGDVVD
jgi:hypothetical protein